MDKPKYFLLTGDPGIGKTTLIKMLNLFLTSNGIKTSGFYTEEVRHRQNGPNRLRKGFDVVAVAQHSQRGRLARVINVLNEPNPLKFGKYGVLIKEFEDVALPSLKEPEEVGPHLYIIDEIGAMEILSNTFKSRVTEIFSPYSNSVVLATIPKRKTDKFIEKIRNNANAKVWMITKQNRSFIHQDIINVMAMSLNLNFHLDSVNMFLTAQQNGE